MDNQSTIKDTTANPAPLGLMGFGMTTVLLNLHNAGLFGLDSPILAMGIFYGGMAQVFAGLMEWKKGNTFGTTAFSSYGLFWLSLVAIWVLPKIGWSVPPETVSMACYLAIWGVFTFLMFFGTLRTNRALQFVFASLAILFFLLAIATATGSESVHRLAGFEGIVCGLSAIYTAIAQVVNEAQGRTVLPICPVSK